MENHESPEIEFHEYIALNSNKLTFKQIFDHNSIIHKILESDDHKDLVKNENVESLLKNLRVFNSHENPLYLAEDWGKIVYKNQNSIRKKIKDFETSGKYIERIKGKVIINGKPSHNDMCLLTRRGLDRITYESKSSVGKLFRRFVSDVLYEIQRKEIVNCNNMLNKLKQENEELIKQSCEEIAKVEMQWEQKAVNQFHIIENLKDEKKYLLDCVSATHNKLNIVEQKLRLNEIARERSPEFILELIKMRWPQLFVYVKELNDLNDSEVCEYHLSKTEKPKSALVLAGCIPMIEKAKSWNILKQELEYCEEKKGWYSVSFQTLKDIIDDINYKCISIDC